MAQYPGVRLLKENEALDGYRLYFGNAPDLECPWSGDIFAFTLYDRGLALSDLESGWEHWQSRRNLLCTRNAAVACYRFDRRQEEKIEDLSGSDNNLSVPDLLIFHKKALRLPTPTDFIHQDPVVNLVGFMPFGFLVCRLLLLMERLSKKTGLIVTIAMGFAISLSIEITQVWLPGRDSSMLDLVANTVGTAIGGATSGSLGLADEKTAKQQQGQVLILHMVLHKWCTVLQGGSGNCRPEAQVNVESKNLCTGLRSTGERTRSMSMVVRDLVKKR